MICLLLQLQVLQLCGIKVIQYSVQHQLIMLSIFIIIISDDHNEEKGRVWRLLMTSVMVIQQVFLV